MDFPVLNASKESKRGSGDAGLPGRLPSLREQARHWARHCRAAGSEGASVIIDYAGHAEGAEETRRAIENAGSKGKGVQADISKLMI